MPQLIENIKPGPRKLRDRLYYSLGREDNILCNSTIPPHSFSTTQILIPAMMLLYNLTPSICHPKYQTIKSLVSSRIKGIERERIYHILATHTLHSQLYFRRRKSMKINEIVALYELAIRSDASF